MSEPEKTTSCKMKTFSCFLLGAAFSINAAQVFSQSKNGVKMIKPPAHQIAVDGNLKDWGDSLSYYNEAKKINYALAKDQENLYFAIRIENRQQQEQAMRNGITLAFNPEGKKKEAFSLTFPSPDQSDDGLFVMPQKDNAITEQQLKKEDMEDRRKADLLKLRDISVKGFKDIETDHISTANTYGIKTVLNIDEKGALVYEAAIPVKMLHLDNASSKPWAFDIKINSFAASAKDNHAGLKPPGEAGGMGGMGRGGMSGGMRNGGMRGGGMGNTGGYAGQGDQGKAVEIKDKFMW